MSGYVRTKSYCSQLSLEEMLLQVWIRTFFAISSGDRFFRSSAVYIFAPPNPLFLKLSMIFISIAFNRWTNSLQFWFESSRSDSFIEMASYVILFLLLRLVIHFWLNFWDSRRRQNRQSLILKGHAYVVFLFSTSFTFQTSLCKNFTQFRNLRDDNVQYFIRYGDISDTSWDLQLHVTHRELLEII